MSTIGQRIKDIRNSRGYTQEKFASELKLKQQTIAVFEAGKRNPSDRTLTDICDKFGVNELWLRTGIGEPEKKLEGEERFALNIGKLQDTDNETVMRWVNAIAETNPELLGDIEKFFMTLLGIKKEPD